MNSCNFIGHLTGKPQLNKKVKDGDETIVAHYVVAVNYGDNGTLFVPCAVFGRQAEAAEKFLDKGSKVGVSGRMVDNSYTNRDGNKVFAIQLIVSNQTFCDKKQ